jgi:16S rRNA (adenine1518-N6/adenine1519-N6)-dimethyltransferase
LKPLREVIAQYGLGATKALGQNFLLDLNLTQKIARAGGDLSGCTAIEIGPGPGGLTRALLNTQAEKVIAIEYDPRCVLALEELAAAYPDKLELLHRDALETDVSVLGKAPRAVVANLPYNIATPLLLNFLRQSTAYKSLTLMFQREVAERLVAKPRTKAYGRLSVMTQWRMEAKILFDVHRSAFTPPPKITSTVVQLIPRLETQSIDFTAMERVVAAAFGQRRKMLRQSLKSLGDIEALLEKAGIEPTARAEELGVEDFIRLTEFYTFGS